MNRPQLPNVILLTDDTISQSQGTGVRLLKHFAGYPEEKLLNIFWYSSDKSALKNSIEIPQPTFTAFQRLIRKSCRIIARMPWQEQDNRSFARKLASGIKPQIEAFVFHPNVIYSNCYHSQGLVILHQLALEYGQQTRIIQHFHDVIRNHDHQGYSRILRLLSPHLAEVWALNNIMASKLSRIINRQVKVVSPLRDNIPRNYKLHHKNYHSNFTAVMLGNIWIPSLLEDIRAAWKWIGNQLGEIRPIQWFCHPQTYARMKENSKSIGPEVIYSGFVPEKDLLEKLRQVDMAIILFNKGRVPESDYALFSIPSRITELASVGLPMFFVAGPNTATYEYVNENEIGVCEIPENIDTFRRSLLSFIKDKNRRAQYSRNARKLAEKDFDITKYRDFLYNKLIELSPQHSL